MAIFAGQEFTPDQAAAWSAVEETFARFDAADEYVFSVPMWNAGVPYVLKQLIDVISQPGLLFGFDPEHGYTGLLRNKRAVVAATSAVYGVGRPASFGSDFQTTFFEDWLQWAGISDITTLEFRPNVAVADADQRRVEAHQRAVEAGRAFGLTGAGDSRKDVVLQVELPAARVEELRQKVEALGRVRFAQPPAGNDPVVLRISLTYSPS